MLLMAFLLDSRGNALRYDAVQRPRVICRDADVCPEGGLSS